MGYVNAGDSSPSGNDPKVKDTLLRHGNWDSVTRATVWNQSIADTNMPASLYLAGKPGWWGDLAWPPYGGDLNPMVGTIPAESRLNSIRGSVSRPSPPQNLRVVNRK